jgi:beta propeller repeat protein
MSFVGSRLRVGLLAFGLALVAGGGSSSAAVPGAITQLTTGAQGSTQTWPMISGSRVVWTNAGNDLDVWYLDLSTGAPAINLTNTPAEQEFLEDIDGTQVVLTRTNQVSAGDIVLIDAATGVQTTIAGAGGGVHYEQPAIRGRYIVFVRASGQFDIDGYDVALGSPFPRPLTNDAAVQARPRVSGDLIVWEDYRNGNADIYGFRISTGQELTIATGASKQSQPDVDGEWVVWVDDASGSDQLWAANLSTGVTRQLTTAASAKVQPRISGTRVVWADDRNGNLDVYTYDLANGVEDVLVAGAGDQMLSDIDGNRVVYTSNETGFESVYLFTIASTPPPPPPSDVPAGCDPARTRAVSTPLTLQRSGRGQTAGMRIYMTNDDDARSAVLCVENGKADGSERTTQVVAINDGAVVLTPSDLRPGADGLPPRWVAVPLRIASERPMHILAASLVGQAKGRGVGEKQTVTLTVRIPK